MNLLRARLNVLGLLVCLAVLPGCPDEPPEPAAPVLSVWPVTMDFGAGASTLDIAITNTGEGTLDWWIQEVSWTTDGVTPGLPAVTEPAEISWLEVSATSGQTLADEIVQVRLTANRTGIEQGELSGVGLLVNSGSGDPQLVRVSMTVPPVVSPPAISAPAVATSTQFTIQNVADVTLPWTVQYLTDPSDSTSAIPLPPWLWAVPGSGELAPDSQVSVGLNWDPWEGDPQDFSILVTLGTTEVVVPISFGELNVSISPTIVSLFGLGDSNVLNIVNDGTESVEWQIRLHNLVELGGDVPVSASRTTGTVGAGETAEVELTLDAEDPDGEILYGNGYYELTVETATATLTAPILIEQIGLPEILVSAPPSQDVAAPPPVPITSLDFGTDEYQMTFYVGNLGPVGSVLHFDVSHEDEGSARPIIVSAIPDPPTQYSTDCDENVFYLAGRVDSGVADLTDWLCAVPVTVTINRDNIREAVEYRDITISAMDASLQEPLAEVTPVRLSLRVERPPIRFEGAQHRSRPPFLARFVFLLRNSIGEAIDTLDEDVFAQLQDAFTVYEDGALLPEETNYFVTYAKDLRYDVVLLMDLSESMYEAGTDHVPDRLEPGEAIEDILGAARTFVEDMSPSYNLALMEHHDRQQSTRLLHPFSTADDSLIEALDNLSIPEGAHGVSELYDALMEACDQLEAKDATAEPFITDADVRALVFVTDGNDTSSTATPASVIGRAQELKIRLYPIAYGSRVNDVDLISMAAETGGHFYRAEMFPASGQATLATLLGDPDRIDPEAKGLIPTELERQIVLSYVSPIPQGSGSHNYMIQVDYAGETGTVENSVLTDENSMALGDVRAGQVSMWTPGISDGTAEVYIRSEYTPRNVSQFRFRLIESNGATITADQVALSEELDPADETSVLGDWRLIDEGHNISTLIADGGDDLNTILTATSRTPTTAAMTPSGTPATSWISAAATKYGTPVAFGVKGMALTSP